MSQRSRVLALLEARGPRGVTPIDFAAPNIADDGKPIMRVAARIGELREDGLEIVTLAGPSGVARYVLIETATPRLWREAA